MAIFRGIAFILSDGQSISIFNDTFRLIGVGRVLGLPRADLGADPGRRQASGSSCTDRIVGRNLYAIGGNPVVARLSGININRYRVGIYVMSGAVAGIAWHPAGRSDGLRAARVGLAGA